MSRILIVYGTKSGCTQGVAGKIASAVARPGFKVDIAAADNAPDPAVYDAVFVGSGIRVGQWHEHARDWVVAHAATLKSKPVAFFSVGLLITQGAARTAEVRAFTDPLIEQTGVQPVDIGLFAGWNEPKRFTFVERIVMRAMKAPEGDQRDWDAIEAWAQAAVPKLAA